eukprot:COSAG02_NODE_928_length_15853_cov_9.053574_12_plen_64_part_00
MKSKTAAVARDLQIVSLFSKYGSITRSKFCRLRARLRGGNALRCGVLAAWATTSVVHFARSGG